MKNAQSCDEKKRKSIKSENIFCILGMKLGFIFVAWFLLGNPTKHFLVTILRKYIRSWEKGHHAEDAESQWMQEWDLVSFFVYPSCGLFSLRPSTLRSVWFVCKAGKTVFFVQRQNEKLMHKKHSKKCVIWDLSPIVSCPESF